MRKSAVVVIRMQQNSNFNLLYPDTIDWDVFKNNKPSVPFAESVIDYLSALSGSLLKDRQSRLYPDVVTFAYFCRKSNLLKLKSEYIDTAELRLGRGVAFHIAPSNVPVNFAYSLVAGMLSGNVNIVRVSSKEFPQVDLIIKHMKDILHAGTIDRQKLPQIALISYSRDSDATAFFSKMAATRIIWGGDSTIATIRKNELPPRSFDICFADRYSIAVINPDAVMKADDKDMNRIAEDFYNDTYLFDQNACSAPRLIFWTKSKSLNEAKERFWNSIHDYTLKHYNLQAVLCVDKLTAFYRQSIDMDIRIDEMPDNLIVRTDILSQVPTDIDSYRCAGGFFTEKTIDSLDEIAPMISNKYQTMAYFGFDKEELENFVISNELKGIDRIVPIGRTTEFSLTWDGYNLIDMMSRIISVK